MEVKIDLAVPEPLADVAAVALLTPLLDACADAGYCHIEIEPPVTFPPRREDGLVMVLTLIRGHYPEGAKEPRAPRADASSSSDWPAIWNIVYRLIGPYNTGSSHQVQVRAPRPLRPGTYYLFYNTAPPGPSACIVCYNHWAVGPLTTRPTTT